jgi:uncharacterized SAM-binding protein YcdF (DUF218 family)
VAGKGEHLVIVLGYRAPDAHDEHLIGDHAYHRIRHAERLVAAGDVHAVVFSGWGDLGGPSEARQMAAAWSGPPVAFILEEESRNTAENAAFCLKIARSMPNVERVTVITCDWHVRSRYFFRDFRQHGIEVTFDFVTDARKHRLTRLPKELRGVRRAPAERRAARDRAGAAQPQEIG